MEAKTSIYVPACFKTFQGFNLIDIKEFVSNKTMQLIYEQAPDKVHTCNCCGSTQGAKHSQYRVIAKHMRMMGWLVSINFFREKRWCEKCQGNTSEFIDFLCPT